MKKNKRSGKKMKITSEMKKELKDVFNTIYNISKDMFKDDATGRYQFIQKIEQEIANMSMNKGMSFKEAKDSFMERLKKLAEEVSEERRATKLFRSSYIG